MRTHVCVLVSDVCTVTILIHICALTKSVCILHMQLLPVGHKTSKGDIMFKTKEDDIGIRGLYVAGF